jgi:hypothetical protein
MPAVSISKAAAYRFSRYYAGLQAGPTLTVQTKRQDPVAIHFAQGSICSSCGLTCLCMVLSAYGLAKPSALENMSHRQSGVAAEVWRVLGPFFMTGITAPELKSAIESLSLPIKLSMRHCTSKTNIAQLAVVSEFAVNCLFKGRFTMLAYASLKNRHQHWLTGIGVEGLAVSHAAPTIANVDTLLAIDPADGIQPFAVSNARLRRDVTSRRKASPRWVYEAAGFKSEPVALVSALCFELLE